MFEVIISCLDQYS